MKNYLKYFLLLIMISCKAQSPIINLTDYNETIPTGSYLKDTFFDLDPFVGTYVFEEGNIYFKVILKKIVILIMKAIMKI